MPKQTSAFYVGRRRCGDYQLGVGGPGFWDPKVGFAFIKFRGTITREVAVRMLHLSLKPGALAKLTEIAVKHVVVKQGKGDPEDVE